MTARPARKRSFRPTNVYEWAKAAAEAAVRARWGPGFPAVIVRPGLVYGPGDIHLLPFFQSILRHRFRPIGRREAWLHPIYIDDMTEALVRCGRRRAAIGECFHIAGTEAGGDRRPGAPDRRGGRHPAAAGPDTRVPRPGRWPHWVTGSRPRCGSALPLTRSRLEFLTHSRMYDVTKAERLLGFTAPTDLPTGLARTVAWYRQSGYLPLPAAALGQQRGGGAALRVRDHVLISTAGAALAAPFIGRRALGLWAGSVLIDADHYAWFCVRQRRWIPGRRPASSTGRTCLVIRRREPCMPRRSCSWFCCSGSRDSRLLPVGLGMGLHVALDTWHAAQLERARRGGAGARWAHLPGLRGTIRLRARLAAADAAAVLQGPEPDLAVPARATQAAHARPKEPAPWT